MIQTIKPDKHQVRNWQRERAQQRTPPQKPEDVRRELGWNLLEAERRERRQREEND